jgi:hypothetical protein
VPVEPCEVRLGDAARRDGNRFQFRNRVTVARNDNFLATKRVVDRLEGLVLVWAKL